MQHLPHAFQATSVGATLFLELALVLMMFLPRRFRIACFLIATPWQLGVILTSNYAFLNYLVLAMGVLLLDDRFLARLLPARVREKIAKGPEPAAAPPSAGLLGDRARRLWKAVRVSTSAVALRADPEI